ncbi:MAG: single-stranded DNA-binding protein [Patescibacteria group bacterium]|nr:single-stranded DNA-binding protein [Patescibacteria group bacterium]
MSTRSLNKVLLIGNLTRDPELKYTPTGAAVCTIGLATNRSWTTESGEKREEVEYHRLVAWGKLAELCSQLLAKGRKIYVEGRIQTRKWTGQDGQERTTVEIVMDDMMILDSKRSFEEGKDQGAAYDYASQQSQQFYSSESQHEHNQQPQQQSDQLKKEEVSIDDIPF